MYCNSVKKKDEGAQKKHKMTTSATTLSSRFEVVNAKHRQGSSEHEQDINDPCLCFAFTTSNLDDSVVALVVILCFF